MEGMEGLLWSQRVAGHLWCLVVLGVVGYMWRLRVAGPLRLAGLRQRGLGVRGLRVSGALLLPRHPRALQIVFLQLSEGNLHVGARVGVSVTGRADLLEMVCGGKATMSHTKHHLLYLALGL